MIQNLKIAFRSLFKNRLYSAINIAGFAVSLTVCSFIFQWANEEKNYDRFHDNADEIYIGVAHFTDGDFMQKIKYTPGIFALVAKESFVEVSGYCRIRDYTANYIIADEKKVGEKIVFVADSAFFTFFNFPILKGHSYELLRRPDEVVISENLANELFGSDNPIGKTIRTNSISQSYKDTEKSYQIVAVMKDLPSNTSLPRADLVIPQNSDPYEFYTPSYWNGWGSCDFLSFIRVKKGTEIKHLAKEISSMQTQYRDSRFFTLQLLVNMHLYTLSDEPAGIKTVWIFIWIACAILIIACINYINLVTARSSRKHREVGLKKILGARKLSLFFQLITESVLLFLFAIIISISLNILLSNILTHFSGRKIFFGLNIQSIWKIYGGMFLGIIVIAGIYPALSLSSFKLLSMQQGNLINKGNVFFRKFLVVIQFIASYILITATYTLASQLTYIRMKSPVNNMDQIFTVLTHDMAGHYETIKQELMKFPAVRSVSGASDVLFNVNWSNSISNWDGKVGEGSVSYYGLTVDSAFFNNMSITFVAGSGFVSENETQYIINETAVKTMGLKEPVVGKWMVAFGDWGKIVGVIHDFHFQSLHREIAPLVVSKSDDWASMLYIRTAPNDAGKAIAVVEKLFKEYNPNYTFNYSFMDELFKRLYHSEISSGRLFSVFSLIAILISCLGLFGLVTYTVESKTKEIGIRKVLGASESEIIMLLTKEFLMLVGIAILTAFPIAYYWLEKLLQDFAYRISLGWWIFAISGVITILLTLLTVVCKAKKAATANPVDAIKTD